MSCRKEAQRRGDGGFHTLGTGMRLQEHTRGMKAHPTGNRCGAQAAFLGHSVLPVPSSASPQAHCSLWLLLPVIFTGYRQIWGEEPHLIGWVLSPPGAPCLARTEQEHHWLLKLQRAPHLTEEKPGARKGERVVQGHTADTCQRQAWNARPS